MKRYIFLLTLILTVAVAEGAQRNDTLRREVTIVRDFTPTIRNAEKINTLPPISTPSFERKDVNYSYNVLSTEIDAEVSDVSVPYNYVMQRIDKTQVGYLNFDMGMHLSMAANAGVRIIDTLKDRLALAAQYTSINGDVPINSTIHLNAPETSRQMFHDARAGLHYDHIFNNNIRLSINGAYRFVDFNYYGVIGKTDLALQHPHQQVHNFNAEITVDNKEARKYDYEQWLFRAGYEQFNTRNGAYVTTPGSEHHAYADVEYNYQLDARWSAGANLQADYLLYYGVLPNVTDVEKKLAFNDSVNTQRKQVLMARFNPYVEWNKHRANFHVGAKLDVSVGDKTILRFAPDVHFNWEFVDRYFFYIHVDGGKQLHTWNEMSKYCLYFDPSKRIPSTYSPVDARAGLRMGILPELSLTLYGGYEIAEEALFQELDMSLHSISFHTLGATCIKAGVMLNAHITEYVTLSADAAYREWRQGDNLITYDRPRWEANASLTAHPISQLDVEVGYNMLLDRDFGKKYGKLNDVHNLQASIKYRPLEWLSLTVHGNNLLNRSHDYYYGLPAPGLQVMGGVGVKF